MWRKLALLIVANLNISAVERYAGMGLLTLAFLAAGVARGPHRMLLCQRVETLAQFACAITAAVLVVARAGPSLASVLVVAVNVPAAVLIPVIYQRTSPLQAQRALRRASSSFSLQAASILRGRNDVLLELQSDRSSDGRGTPRNSLCVPDPGPGAPTPHSTARSSCGRSSGTKATDVPPEWHSDSDGGLPNPRAPLCNKRGLSAEHLAKLGHRLDATE